MAEGMIFLPDEAELEWSAGVGIISAPLEEVHSLARSALRTETQEEGWRGLITLCLLADAWKDGPRLTVRTLAPDRSPFASAVLERPISLVMLEDKLLGVLDAGLGVIPAAQMDELFLPERVCWYDGAFLDPTDMLSERDRHVLIGRLGLLGARGDGQVQRFVAALNQAGLRAAQPVAHGEEAATAALALRMKAVLGGLPGLEEHQAEYASAPVNPLLQALGLEERAVERGPVSTWLYRGVPVARTSVTLALESAGHPDENNALADMAREIDLLERYSPQWRWGLTQQLMRFVAQHHDERAMLEPVRTLAEELLRQATAPIAHETLTLTWPWKEQGVEQLLWREALDEGYDAGMLNPFADELCLVPGGAGSTLGDAFLSRLCVLPGDGLEPASAVIPPLSMTMAACAGEALAAESFVFRRLEDGAVLASFALKGKSAVVLERVYQPEEIRRLSMDETPTVAVWPALRLPQEQWHAYYVYVHGGTIQACALQNGVWTPTEDRLFSVIRAEEYPAMIALTAGQKCLGVLPNAPRSCQPAKTGPALGLMDVGASGITLALSQNGEAELMRIPALVQTLMRGGRAVAMAEEFLPAAPMGPVLSAAVELFNRAEEPQPLVDGHILLSEGCDALAERNAKALHCAWKWSVDAAARRARRLMLQQAMLTASLAAALKGATSISWRIALPEDMAAEGRRALWQDVTDLAPLVARQCGLPLADTTVSHADESLALGAYLRSDSGVRGGFAALDVGSGNASMALWLRGMNRPAVCCTLPLGVQSVLLDALLQSPDALEDDFADMPDPAARESISLLAAQMRSAVGPKAMEKCRVMLDHCLQSHGAALSDHMNQRFHQGSTTLTQCLIFQAFAALLSISGLVQEQVRRDPLLNDYLPAEMTYIMAGRGSQLMRAMPDPLKNALAQFVRLEMSADHPVRSLRFLFSDAPKCETVLGLARVADVRTGSPAAPQSTRASTPLHMPPELLVMRFLSAFRSVFSQECDMLYGPLFDRAGMITVRGEEAVRAAAARHFASGREPEAALAACLLELREIPT